MNHKFSDSSYDVTEMTSMSREDGCLLTPIISADYPFNLTMCYTRHCIYLHTTNLDTTLDTHIDSSPGSLLSIDRSQYCSGRMQGFGGTDLV